MVTSQPNHLASPPQTPPNILSLDLNNLADDICSILFLIFQFNIHFAQSQNLAYYCYLFFYSAQISQKRQQIEELQTVKTAGL